MKLKVDASSGGVASPTPTARPIDPKRVRRAVAARYGIDPASLQTDATAANAVGAGRVPIPNAIDVYSGERVTTQVGNLIPNLETIDASKLPEEATIRDRLIEQLLDDANRFIQVSAAIRQQYADLAKIYMETRLKSEEFFRLDDVHQEEVANHIYELPFWEADNDQIALKAALEAAKRQKTSLDTLYEGPLSDQALANYVFNNKELAALPSSSNQAELRENAGKASEHRNALELASWNYSRETNNQNVAELSGRLDTAVKKRAYLEKDVFFRSQRAAVSRALAYVQLDENCRPGSVVNFSDRLTELKKQFDLSFTKLVGRILIIRRAARALYEIDMPLQWPNTSSQSQLDYLIAWLLKFQDEITKYRRNERVGIFTIWLSQRFKDFKKALRTGINADFQVSTADTAERGGLLRGVTFEYLGSGGRPISLEVQPPASVTGNLEPAGRPTTLRFGRVLPVAYGFDVRPQAIDTVWNGVPYGAWHVSTRPIDLAELGVDDIAMHLWATY